MKREKFVYNWQEVPVIVDVGYVCRILGVTADTVQKLLRSGTLRGFKVGRDWRICKSDIMAFIGEQEATA